MSTRSFRRAAAFTLIELIVVLSIVALLTIITVVVTLRMQERDQVPRAATLLQGMLAQAKARAAAERVNVGVRLLVRIHRGEAGGLTDGNGDGILDLRDVGDLNGDGIPGTWADLAVLYDGQDNDGNLWPDDLLVCDAVEFVRDPGDFTEGTVGSPNPQGPPLNVLILDRGTPALNLYPLSRFVQVGDQIEILDLGQTYQITGLQHDPSGPSNLILLDRAVSAPVTDARYRILRQPQPIPGEKPFALPGGAVLDLHPGMTLGVAPRGDRGPWEIVFSPRGSVVSASAAQDLVCLWVHHVRGTPEPDPDLEALVTISPKTGAVAVYPVDRLSGDPHSFARRGRAPGAP
jgi:prepilin-type N-terminal cleavage/methylation domain-containing protein